MLYMCNSACKGIFIESYGTVHNEQCEKVEAFHCWVLSFVPFLQHPCRCCTCCNSTSKGVILLNPTVPYTTSRAEMYGCIPAGFSTVPYTFHEKRHKQLNRRKLYLCTFLSIYGTVNFKVHTHFWCVGTENCVF